MVEQVESQSFEKIKKFYKDHFIKYGKNLSFSVLFFVQPPDGNGLPRLTPADLSNPSFCLTDAQKKEALSLFTDLCVALYPLCDFPLRKRFVSMMSSLSSDRLLSKIEDAKDIKGNILSAMKIAYENSNSVLVLDGFFKDFPEARDAETGKATLETIIKQKKSLAEILSDLLLYQGGVDEITKTSRELISSLILDSGEKTIESFQSEFTVLEKADVPKRSLRNLALVLLSRYFYSQTPAQEYTSPSWKYLIETYDIQLDDLLGIIKKKKREPRVIEDNMMCLCESYTSEQRNESITGLNRLKKQFLNSYNAGLHSICLYLTETFSFLKEDKEIEKLLPYMLSPDGGEKKSQLDLEAEQDGDKSRRTKYKKDITRQHKIDKSNNNARIVKKYLSEGTVASVKKAAGFILSLSGDSHVSSGLRETFVRVVAYESNKCSIDFLKEALGVMDKTGLEYFAKDVVGDVYRNYMKKLLIEGKNDSSLLKDLYKIIDNGFCSRDDGKIYVKQMFLKNILVFNDSDSLARLAYLASPGVGSKEMLESFVQGGLYSRQGKEISMEKDFIEKIGLLDSWSSDGGVFSYPKNIYLYVKATKLFSDVELFQEILDITTQSYPHSLSMHGYFHDRPILDGFKKMIVQWSAGVPELTRNSLLQSVFKNTIEGDFLCADLFPEFFGADERQKFFTVYMDSLVEKGDYDPVVAILERVGQTYRYDRAEIMREIVLGLCKKNKYEDADDVAHTEEIDDKDLLDEIGAHRFSHLLQGKISNYIALPEIHEAFAANPVTRATIIDRISKIDFMNRSKKDDTLRGFLDAIKPIFFDNENRYNGDLKEIIAKRALEGFATRSSIDPSYAELYKQIQIEYGDDIDKVEKIYMQKYRKLRSEADARVKSQDVSYDQVVMYCEEIIEVAKKEVQRSMSQEKKEGRIQLQKKREDLAKEISLDEYNTIFSHLVASVGRVQRGERLRVSRESYGRYSGSYGFAPAPKSDDIMYYNERQIPEVFAELLVNKLPLVNELDQRRLREKTLEARASFYEESKNYEGLDMLEREYGYSLDRTDKQRKALRAFLENGDKEKVEQITELIALFGMSNAADILYQLYPEYRGLGADEVASILSNYLGETLINHKGIGLHQIPANLNISGIGLLDSLFTVIERDFVRDFTENKKANPDLGNEIICQNYLSDLKSRFAGVKGNHPRLNDVFDHFTKFVQTILSVEKPNNFVDNLMEGREFPDFLQKLNAALVTDKRRFLIADGMGLGKSLSAILAKEYGGAKSCLVVVPSLLTGTRKGYLSDIDDPERKRRGYYKKGKSPHIFVVDGPSDVALLKKDTYDYVIISQEKLQGDDYVDALVSQGFDFMIVDEVHKLKNISEGKRASGLLRVTQYIEEHEGTLCLLSGTPIPNKIGDIAILLKLLYPEKYGEVENDELVASIIKGGDMLNLRSLLLPMMQMKKLTDHIDMPQLIQSVKHFPLSEQEQLYYDAFIEDNTMTGVEKLMTLRMFLLNPQLVGIHTIEQSSKAKKIGEDANDLFKTKSKIIFFANTYTAGVLRAKEGLDKTFIEQMNLDKDIQIRIIDGRNPHERQAIQDEFNSSNQKIALFISGSTADVGIDLTAGEHVVHINEPWTQAELDQQEARVYRYGQGKDIETTKYIAEGTVEQGIHDYVIMKHNIILKLYYGLKLSELERRVITEAENTPKMDSVASGTKKGSSSVNTVLTTFIRSAKDKLNSMFGYLREGGLEKVEQLVETRGKEMADYYALLGPRSYQANVNRLHATLLHVLLKKEHIVDPKIIDLGSGPKMLEQHLDADLQNCVTSVDINPNHFTQEDINSGKAVISNFGSLPFQDGEVDIICSSLSFNETAWSRPQKVYERLEVLFEMFRVLKPGGIAIISTIYSLQYKYPEELKNLLTEIGFEIVPEYSGRVIGKGGSSFETKTLVIKKVAGRKCFSYEKDRTISRIVASDAIKGLDMVKDGVSLSSQEYVLEDVEFIPSSVDAKVSYTSIALSKSGKTIKQTEEAYKNLVAEMQTKDGVHHIADISEDTLRKWGFGRYMNAASCVIVVRLPNNAGLFRYSMPLKKKGEV